jgi:hypothetical protein
MASNLDRLDAALERVRSERAMVRRERERFEEFREAVSLTPAVSEAANDTVNGTADLVETFRDTVMSTPDFEETYGGSIEENLEREFSSSIGTALHSDSPFTQRLKRNLLVQCSQAIERRKRLEEELADEARSIKTARVELRAIRSEVDALPECTVEHGAMESFLDTWEAYDRLEVRCERLLEERQQHFSTVDQSHSMENASRAFNKYLYADLGTVYPVLSEIGSTLESITAARGATATGGPPSNGP